MKQPTKSLRSILLCSLVLGGLCLVTLLAGRGGNPPSAPSGSTGVAVAQTEPETLLDLRDAPVRQVLEMLFASGNSRYVLDEQVRGVVTVRATGQPLEKQVPFVLRSANPPLDMSQSNDVVTIKPLQRQNSTPRRLVILGAVPAHWLVQGSDRWRVSGILSQTNSVSWAILEKWIPSKPDAGWGQTWERAEARVVRVGARTPSLFAGKGDLLVEGITPKAVILRGPDQSETVVGLENLPPTTIGR